MAGTKADAALEDLEVQEVSFVDAPANRRKWLLTKQEGIMPQNGILDMLGLKKNQSSSGVVKLDNANMKIKINKALQPQVEQILSAALEKMTSVASNVPVDKAEVPDEWLQQLFEAQAQLAALLEALSGDEPASEETADPNEDSEMDKMVKAISSGLLDLVNKVKSVDKAATSIPEDILKDLHSLVQKFSALKKMTDGGSSSGGSSSDNTDEEDQQEKEKRDQVSKLEVFKGTGSDVILKRGDALITTSVAELQVLHKNIVDVLQQVGGSVSITKSENAVDRQSLIDGFTKMEEIVKSAVGGLKESLTTVQQKIEKLEGVHGGGNAADTEETPSSQVQKNNKSLWAGIF